MTSRQVAHAGVVEELAHGGDLRRLFGQRLEDSAGILEAVPLVGPVGVGQPLDDVRGPLGADRGFQLFGHAPRDAATGAGRAGA